jgi:DNA-binding winged helix-turn-helix (wHTH) protein/tetratricopeptide (TPR) repeat protein
MKTEGIFEFRGFRVDALARTLRREDEVVTLNRRAFDVLLYLVQNPGKVVARDELLRNIWPDTFVDENSLAQSISALRRALDERPGDNSYIVTLPGRGYQFVARVQAVSQTNLAVLPDTPSAASPGSGGLILQQETIRTSVIREEEQPLSLPASRNRLVAGLIAVFVVAGISGGAIYVWKQFRGAPPATNPMVAAPTATPSMARRSVAVLGFHNLSGRPEEAWLSTALTEMLTTELEAGEKLRLVSGEDVARTKLDLPLADAGSLSRDTLARLHKNLDSDLIALGSYTALGEKPVTRIRLDVRLQDTVSGDTIAEAAVVGSEADLFDMVSQAGAQLRAKLGVEAVSPVEAVSVRASLPANRDAARLYSEGLARLRVFDALAARDLLQQAVAADPKYSLAHSALAEAWSRLGYDKKAQQEARKAYDLSANLSREEKLVVEGRYRDINHDHDKAIEVYRTLFTLFPDNVDYGLKLAAAQTSGSKGHDALATVESLRKLEPSAPEDPRIEFQEANAWGVLEDLKHQEEPLQRTVDGARAQGARLILARARRIQCKLFGAFRQMQDAAAACREARDLYSAAGDQEGEADALCAWADTFRHTDAPESIRLYKQAQTIYRKNGSEFGVAQVLNNLGVLYEEQGDLATAEKMYRQARVSFRLLDDKGAQGAATLNIANERLEQGDLRDALQLYEEVKQFEDPGDATGGSITAYNVASVYQLQGDLAGARRGFEQSLTGWQKSGDQSASAYAFWSLGGLLVLEADFSESRKMYERALALRTTAGEKVTIAETQLGLADLSLEEARSPAEQEAAARQVLDVFQKQGEHDDEIQSWCVLARALLAEGKAADAEEAAKHARALAARSQNPEIRWQTAIVAARVETARKDFVHSAAELATRKELTAIVAKSRNLGYGIIELDARLALAEIEIKARQSTAGLAHLNSIEQDAKAKGCNLIAGKAALARG